MSCIIELVLLGCSRAEFSKSEETHLTNFIFDGARADLTKGLSVDPAFQVTHSFSLGSQSAPSSYHFSAVFANANVGLPKTGAAVKPWTNQYTL